MKGSHGGEAKPHLDIPRYMRLHNQGKLELDGLITHEYPLHEINKAIDMVRGGEAGRVLVKMDA